MSGFSATATRPQERSEVDVFSPPRALVLLAVVVALYAAFGKGFAYAGVRPVFIGEVALVVVLFLVVRPTMPLPRSFPAALTGALVGLMLVQLFIDRLDPVVPLIESLRGVAPVYYSAFAFAMYALLRDFERAVGRAAVESTIERAVGRAMPFVLGAAVLLSVLLLVHPSGLPVWPNSGQAILASKSGDIAVTLVLAAPFLAWVGDRPRVNPQRMMFFAAWGVAALLITFRSRGALLALVAGFLIISPNAARIIKAVMAATVITLVIYATGVSMEVRGREISYNAIGDAVASMLKTAPEESIQGSYVGTASWRTDWWDEIWQDVNDQAMVVHGHGWGDNLYVRYMAKSGSVARDDRVLRLPHNIFFSLAGRAGAVMAIGFLLVPTLTVARTFRRREALAAPRFSRAVRGAIVASLVTGLFDVYIESPQGGIVMWALIGFLWWATAPSAVPAAGGAVPAGAGNGAPVVAATGEGHGSDR